VIDSGYGIVGQNPFSVRKVGLLKSLEKGIKYDIKEKSCEYKIIKISAYLFIFYNCKTHIVSLDNVKVS